MIRNLTAALSISLLLAILPSTAAAQEHVAPTPGEEMERLHVFVGHWKGSGTAVAPGMGEVPWTSRDELRLVLDGFFIEGRSDLAVGAPMPLQFQSMMGWDQENQRYVSYGISNNGEHQGFEEMSWVDDDTLVATNSYPKDGEPAINRTTIRLLTNDRYTVVVESAVGAEPFAVMVEGEYERVEEAAEFAAETGFLMAAVPNEMRKLKRMVGDWQQEGWFEFPGMGRMEITGTEEIGYAFAGHAIRASAEGRAGDLPPWTGWSFITWNARRSVYEMVQFTSVGEVGQVDLMWDANDRNALIGLSAARWMGLPMATRSVMTFDDAHLVEITADACVGTQPPERNFVMTYTPKDD